MTRWVAFALVVNAVLVVVLSLARATQAASTGGSREDERTRPERRPAPRMHGQVDHVGESGAADGGHGREDEGPSREDGRAAATSETPTSDGSEDGRARSAGAQPRPRDAGDIRSFSTGALLANVAVTHGTLGAILLVAAWAAGVPATALGIDATANVGPRALGIGLGFGLALYAANELLADNLDRIGVEYSEELRGALGPDSIAGWIVLLAVVLPIIAVFEELLFRAALIGAISAGFGFSPWLLAAFSSLAFGFGHGIQGTTGIVVTGLLGFVLAATFILTGSLLAVIVAHYLINALEFVVHEGLGVEWAS